MWDEDYIGLFVCIGLHYKAYRIGGLIWYALFYKIIEVKPGEL